MNVLCILDRYGIGQPTAKLYKQVCFRTPIIVKATMRQNEIDRYSSPSYDDIGHERWCYVPYYLAIWKQYVHDNPVVR